MRVWIAILALCGVGGCAPPDREDRELLQSDFGQVSAVALVRVESVQNTDTWGMYHENRVEARILETFKGNLRAGQHVTFCGFVEGPRHLEGDNIVFLKTDCAGEGALGHEGACASNGFRRRAGSPVLLGEGAG